MKLTSEQIEKINKECPNFYGENEQGIFNEPNGIPDDMKGLVVYQRYETGGVSGGSCWDDSNPEAYSVSEVPEFKVLDLVLRELSPNISYLDYKKIESEIKSNENYEYEYYGNCTDFIIKFIPLDKVIELITK